MSNFPKSLEDIILNEHKNINEKLKGINYLENLKFNLISKISTLLEWPVLKEDIKNKTNLIIEQNNTKLEAIIFQNNELISQLKKEIKKSTLLLVLDGELKVEIFHNGLNNEFTKINVYKFMGICLPSNTMINLNSSKNSFPLNIRVTIFLS